MPRRANTAAIDTPLHSASPVSALSGVGPKRIEALARLGIHSVGDLLRHFPRRHEDRRILTPIADVVEGDRVQILGTVAASRLVRLRGRMALAELTLEDDTGRIKAVWFGQGYLARSFQPGAQVYLSGPVGKFGGLALRNPDYEILSGDAEDYLHIGRIVPVYPLTEGLSQRMLRQWIHITLEAGVVVESTVPPDLAHTHGFDAAADAIRAAHFPSDSESAHNARAWFAYEELLVLQTGVMRERARRREPIGIVHEVRGPRLAALRASLPFTLTAGQQAAIDEILADMAAPRPMARLVQGDVGCGKTLVAFLAASASIDSGHQAALMAPTELLATQHYRTAVERLAPLGIRVLLLTSSSPANTRNAVSSGQAQVIIGTHALFETATRFHRLGLVIVDEQHRFGVDQRERLAQKGTAPDRLHMTATPIPRTLALTLYGAMDLTVIRDLPPGRRPVETSTVTAKGLAKVYGAIHHEAREGRQAYIVCPRIETSAKNAAGVLDRFAELASGPLHGLRCGLVHGRMDAAEKDDILEAFRTGALDVLVGTTVVEVGVDAPGATTILIEEAAGFGLTQLHQLRGRVGRGAHPGRCFLAGKAKTDEGRARIDVLCRTHDGFRIAEEDFALRGPGEVFGDRQAGLSGLRAADLVRDTHLLLAARCDAEALIARDPKLRAPEHAALAGALARGEALGY